jgi:hypothetical protein
VTLHALLFLADETPHFVKLDSGDADADHAPIVKLCAAFADLEGQLADRLPVDAS